MGNEAIAWGLLESGCTVITSYPGTPASEILGSLVRFRHEWDSAVHAEWSINEKVAYEVALANSYLGARSAVSMKQVGLNVAADPLMSSAYTGVKGGFLVISADDPGPHSSQTEQDSRFMAMSAKIPVFDPASPRQAKDMVGHALNLSEQFELPVMLRPTTRICHARQDVRISKPKVSKRKLEFHREPGRWAATPKFRYLLHLQLNEKLKHLASNPDLYPQLLNAGVDGDTCVVASGVALANTREVLEDLGLFERVPLYQVTVPYPLNPDFASQLLENFRRILVVEETYPVTELQFRQRDRVFGRLSGEVPDAGELDPERIEVLLREFLRLPSIRPRPQPEVKEKRPTLCAGCPHRAAFFAIKRALPKAIFPSDIGCYTLGLNLAAVDTVLCMGAGISMAAGFYHAHNRTGEETPRLAVTIGDSTFFHAGIPPLINAVIHKARFVLVILDNSTTAMTGYQPTPQTGRDVDGSPAPAISIQDMVKACGVRFVREADPYELKEFSALIREADAFSRAADGGVAVVIARHPCLMDRSGREASPRQQLRTNERCKGCRYCADHFECPALVYSEDEDRVHIDSTSCVGCGVCAEVCPTGAIEEQTEET
ncbi:MAG: 4Fe-4S binding protein [Deltaproteobacteria bacterium]|nr:MAG: 4Fe-4S binding protein [Deltaproteobacteria bacterium]